MNNESRTTDMASKKLFTVAARVEPIFVMPCVVTATCKRPGVDVEFLATVLDLADYAIRFVEVDNFTTEIELLKNGTADLSASTYPTDVADRANLTYFEVPITDGLILLVKPGREVRGADFRSLYLNIFQVLVWTTVIAVGLCVLVLRLATQACAIIERRPAYRGTKPFWRRCLSNTWLIFLSVFLNLLSNLFTQFFAYSEPKPTYPFKGFKDFVDKLNNHHCQLAALYSFHPLDHVVKNVYQQNPGLGIKFDLALQVNPIIYKANRLELGEMLMEADDKSCIVGIDYNSMVDYYETIYCRHLHSLHYSKYLPVYYYAYLGRPGLKLPWYQNIKIVDPMIALQTRLYKTYIQEIVFNNTVHPDLPVRKCHDDMKEAVPAVSIYFLVETLALFGVGLLFSVCYLFLELKLNI